jgi:hypothetical protein
MRSGASYERERLWRENRPAALGGMGGAPERRARAGAVLDGAGISRKTAILKNAHQLLAHQSAMIGGDGPPSTGGVVGWGLRLW